MLSFIITILLHAGRGPWQQLRCCRSGSGIAFTNDHILSQTDITGHSRVPQSPSSPLRQRNSSNQGMMTNERQRKIQSWAGSSHPLLSLLTIQLLLRSPQRCHAPDPGAPQELQDRHCRSLIPQQSNRGSSWVLPLAGLPYLFPHPFRLRYPRSASRNEVVARPPLAAPRSGPVSPFGADIAGYPLAHSAGWRPWSCGTGCTPSVCRDSVCYQYI